MFLDLLVATYWWASHVSELSPAQQRSPKTLAMYRALVGSSLLADVLSSYLFYFTLIKSSERLHNKMVLSVVKAPLLYFDKTPLGRILNRFSKDIGNLDNTLPLEFISAVEVCLFAISTILLPVAANFWLLFVALPLVAIALYYGRYYLKSSRKPTMMFLGISLTPKCAGIVRNYIVTSKRLRWSLWVLNVRTTIASSKTQCNATLCNDLDSGSVVRSKSREGEEFKPGNAYIRTQTIFMKLKRSFRRCCQ